MFLPGDLQAAILLYRRQGSVSGDLLSMVMAVAEVQADLCTPLAKDDPADCTLSSPDADWIHDAIGQVASAVAAHSPAGGDLLREFAARCRMIDVDLLAGAARSDNAGALAHVAAVTGVSTELAAMILRMAFQPFYAWRHEASPASLTDQAFPSRNRCPACGGRPLMGKHVEPDGQRFLRCDRCGHEWAFPRIGCPGCGEAEQDDMESLFVHGDEGHRIYLCKRCLRYIKVSDERLLGVRAYLPLEYIVTLHLDEVARQRGFSPIDEDAGSPDVGQQDT